MKNKKIKYKDLCQMVQEQNDQITELKQAINYIQDNYSCEVPFQVKVGYSNVAEELYISYLENGKVNTVTHTLSLDFLSFSKIKEIVKQSDVSYIITLERFKDYYEYYALDTKTWTISNITDIIKSAPNLKGRMVKKND